MHLRWLLGNFTDPQYRIPRREQFRLSSTAHARYLPAGAFLWRTALILLPLLVGFNFIEPMLGWLGYAGRTGPTAFAYVILVLIFWPWCAWMYRSLYVRPIRRAMRAAGYDLCINCGYELRGLSERIDRCPECGQTREAAARAEPSAANPAALHPTSHPSHETDQHASTSPRR